MNQTIKIFSLLPLLAACAGHNATQWRTPPKKPCGIVICEVRGPDKVCGCSGKSGGDLGRILSGTA